MRKCVKADLAKKIEANCPEVNILNESEEPRGTAYIIDGMATLQGLNDSLFNTFDDLCKQVLLKATRLFSGHLGVGVVVFVFDRYDNEKSIKQFERTRRGNSAGSAASHLVAGNRIVPNYASFMKRSANKAALVQFVCMYLEQHLPGLLQHEQYMILAGGYASGEVVKILKYSEITEYEDLYTLQEEADTRMILHAVDLASRNYSRINVRCEIGRAHV
jgi:hypothetical protein